MEIYYNKHYITLRDDNVIIGGWSNGPFNQRTPTQKDILLTDKGSYQFRLFPNGEENPNLYNQNSISLYKWDGSQVLERTKEEIAIELAQKKAEEEAREAERKAKDPTTIMMNMIAEIEDALCELSKEEA